MSKNDGKSLGHRPFAATKRRHRRLEAPIEVEHIQLPFQRWNGHVGPWAEHFGKGRGQVHSLDGGKPCRSCNEVEVAKLLRRVRSRAVWISPYNFSKMPEIWRPWAMSMTELPPWLSQLDSSIRQSVSTRRGGMPDVVAWNDDEPKRTAIFVECKGPKERIGER